MISLEKDTLEYGSLLKAPRGYTLGFAIGTTYSLDFSTLMGAYLSLGLSVDTDSSLADDPMFLFAALSEVRDKVVVFCEKGRVKGDGGYSGLYSQMEGSIVEVDLPPKSGADRYPSFHPKIWILRFWKNENPKEARYRVCVLSRNITQDSSWDLACAFEGDYRVNHSSKSKGGELLEQFVGSLLGHCVGKSPQRSGLEQVKSEIPFVSFKDVDKSGGWEMQLPFLVSGVTEAADKYSFAAELEERYSSCARAVVMSPFISSGSSSRDPMAILCGAFGGDVAGRLSVITRASSLAGVDATRRPWVNSARVFTVRDHLLSVEYEDDEFELAGDTDDEVAADSDSIDNTSVEEDVKPDSIAGSRDIHAKLYAIERESGGRVDLYIGSANASHRGLDVNYEFMAHFASTSPGAFDSLLVDLGIDDTSLEQGSLFELVGQERMAELIGAESSGDELPGRDFDIVLRKLRAEMTIRRQPGRDEFDVTIRMKMASGGAKEIKEAMARIQPQITISLATLKHGVGYRDEVSFAVGAVEDLTMFMRVEACLGETAVKRLVKCKVKEGAEFLEARRVALFKKIMSEGDRSVVDYLRFKLSPNPELASAVEAVRRGAGALSASLRIESLYEDLLRAYSEDADGASQVVRECLELISDGGAGLKSEACELETVLRAFEEGRANAGI